MRKDKTKLFLITVEFPYGSAEDTFLGLEYPLLCEQFDLKVIATEADRLKEKRYRESCDNAVSISSRQNIGEKIFSLLCFLTRRECYQEISEILSQKEFRGGRIYRALMYGAASETFFRRLRRSIDLKRDTHAVFYFYWFDYKCFALCAKKKKYPYIRIITRTHGRDLYDERELYGRQFFKRQMDEQLQKIIFAAQYAKDYYLHRYGKEDSDRYSLHRLGVPIRLNSGNERREKFDGDQPFILLSCSSVIAIKRVGLIIEGLSELQDLTARELVWVHIGDGGELLKLKRLAENRLNGKKNIRFEFMGELPNENVVEYYRNHFVGCFITTTSTEGGAPVSVQEALSFGVPAIVTKVGELPFMAQNNGVLLSENPDGKEIAAAISKILSVYGTGEYWEMCENALDKHKRYFEASRNFTEAVMEISNV